jgi:hypothetical protein
VFPVRYELQFYILFRRNSAFKDIILVHLLHILLRTEMRVQSAYLGLIQIQTCTSTKWKVSDFITVPP